MYIYWNLSANLSVPERQSGVHRAADHPRSRPLPVRATLCFASAAHLSPPAVRFSVLQGHSSTLPSDRPCYFLSLFTPHLGASTPSSSISRCCGSWCCWGRRWSWWRPRRPSHRTPSWRWLGEQHSCLWNIYLFVLQYLNQILRGFWKTMTPHSGRTPPHWGSIWNAVKINVYGKLKL